MTPEETTTDGQWWDNAQVISSPRFVGHLDWAHHPGLSAHFYQSFPRLSRVRSVSVYNEWVVWRQGLRSEGRWQVWVWDTHSQSVDSHRGSCKRECCVLDICLRIVSWSSSSLPLLPRHEAAEVQLLPPTVVGGVGCTGMSLVREVDSGHWS